MRSNSTLQRAPWTGTPVLVTGHTGFKGSWLCTWLLLEGASVSGYGLAPATQPNLFDLQDLARHVDSTIGDIRDLATLEATVARVKPEVIFHLAAQPIVRESIDDPLTTISTNVLGTANLLDVVRRTPTVRAMVVVTSDKCYENTGSPWPYRENEALGGGDPYSASKACSEIVTSAYRRTYFAAGQPAVATARAGNVIGGGDWSRDRLIPDIVRALMQSKDPALRYPGATRPWQHVLDAIHGYVTLAEHLLAHGQRYADVWNFGPSDESGCTVLDLAEAFISAWGSSRRVVVESRVAPNESLALRLDSTRARQALGWSPGLNLDEAIRRTAAWYRAWSEDPHGLTLTEAQVEQFLRLAGRADLPPRHPVLNAV